MRPDIVFRRFCVTFQFLAQSLARACTAALVGTALCTPARAAPADYRFELVTQEAKVGDAVLTIRLVDTRSGQLVTDAVIFAKRIDMAPDSMDEMTSTLAQLPSTEPGLYRFRTKLTMAGSWRLSLGAKVQGETGTVSDKLVFRAVP
ncbi:FixH family protein [Methylobacterium sp. WL18]|nr:FixH family protein [Methylobacterium sp. WL18]